MILVPGGNVTWRKVCKRLRSIRKHYTKFKALIAQLAVQLICNQQAGSSNLSGGTKFYQKYLLYELSLLQQLHSEVIQVTLKRMYKDYGPACTKRARGTCNAPVVGLIPTWSTKQCRINSVGRISGCQPECHRFEPGILLQILTQLILDERSILLTNIQYEHCH